MKTQKPLYLLTLAFLSIPSTAQTGAISQGSSRAWIEHTKTGDVFVTENASFDFVRLLRKDGQGYDWLLVERTEHNGWSDNREGVSGAVTIRAWSLPGKRNNKTEWTVRAHGNVATALPDLGMIRVSSWPCCSAPYNNLYFSLHTGKQLYTTNSKPETDLFGQDGGLIRIDGGYDGTRYTESRYIGFGADTQSRTHDPAIQYGTDQAVMQRLMLRGHEYGDNFDVPKLSVSAVGEGFASYLEVPGPFKCVIRLEFEDGKEVRIPIEDDAMRADKATLPDGYSLVSEKPKSP